MSRCAPGIAALGCLVALATGCRDTRQARPPAQAPAAAELPQGTLDKRSLGYVQTTGGEVKASTVPGTPAAQPALAAMQAARKLIRTGQAVLEVPDLPKAASEIERLVASFGGYVAESQMARGGDEARTGSLTVRVPAERFGEAFAAILRLGKVRAQTTRADDITKAYADLETRLRVKRDAESRVRQILLTRTGRLSDVVEAERELTRLLEEIEGMEGERRYYDQQVALSTITVTLSEPSSALRPSAFAPIREALQRSAEVLATSVAALIMLVVVAAPWLLVALFVWTVVRALRRRRGRRRAASTSGDKPGAPA